MYHSRYGCAVEIWVFISLASPIAYLFDTIYRVSKDKDKHCGSVWRFLVNNWLASEQQMLRDVGFSVFC